MTATESAAAPTRAQGGCAGGVPPKRSIPAGQHVVCTAGWCSQAGIAKSVPVHEVAPGVVAEQRLLCVECGCYLMAMPVLKGEQDA